MGNTMFNQGANAMGYPAKANRFAIQFIDMADALQADPAMKFTKEFKSRRPADKLRLQFYAFRNAARKNDEIKDFPALDTIEVIIEEKLTEGGKVHQLTFQCKDYSEVAMALNDMLRANGLIPSTDPLPTKKTS